ncbi:hypothetical protein CYY_000360 [Polysphondylium violaceum]|nr:hypothetical protein CYY_000360 [Polysphondylium violaceum]
MKVGLEADQNQQGCSFIEQGNTTMTNSEYVKLQVNDHSLYGRFIKRGIIDGRISSVSNQFIKQGESVTNQYNNIHSYIGISIRSYKKLVQLDPDFSVLIDQRPASSDSNALCFAKDKSKLSKAQIAGIVIGSVGFACIIVISAIYYIVKKKKMKIFERKLHSLNKENKTNLK